MNDKLDFVHDVPKYIIDKYHSYYWLAVVGSREYNDYSFVSKNLDYLIGALLRGKVISSKDELIIVSGGARGVDSLAKRYAKDNRLTNINILADWDSFDKIAGFLRNKNIIKYSNRVIAFLFNSSPGTKDSIAHAKRMKKVCHTIKI